MRTRLELVPALLLACLLAACGSDPGTTTANDDSSGSSSTSSTTGTTTDTPTSEPSTDPSGATSTGNPSTAPGTTGDPTGPASTTTADPTDTSSTGEHTTGAISASDTSTSTSDTSDTSDTSTSTSDTSTSASDTSTGDTGDTSTGDPEGLGPAAQDALEALEQAVDGVYFLSESDYPWTPFAIADVAPVTQANVKAVIADVYVFHGDPTLADRAIEPRTFNSFMDPFTVMQGWWGQEELERAAQYQPIRDVFEDQLINLQVFRFGQKFGNVLMGQVDIFVLGETADGDVVGMFTISVET